MGSYIVYDGYIRKISVSGLNLLWVSTLSYRSLQFCGQFQTKDWRMKSLYGKLLVRYSGWMDGWLEGLWRWLGTRINGVWEHRWSRSLQECPCRINLWYKLIECTYLLGELGATCLSSWRNFAKADTGLLLLLCTVLVVTEISNGRQVTRNKRIYGETYL